MRILMLSHSPDNPDGGASRIYHMLSAGLVERGHTVDLRHKEDYRLPGGGLARTVVAKVVMPQWLSRAARTEQLDSYDVVMASGGTAYPLFRKLVAAGAPRPALVSHAHGMSVYDRVVNLAEARLGHLPASAVYRAVSAPLSDRWEYRGVAAADVTVVQNLRDLDQLHTRGRIVHIPAAVHPELLAGSAEITPLDQRVPGQVLWFGTWESRKGAWYVPRAFRRLREARPEARLLVGGTGRSHAELAGYFALQDRASVVVLPRVSRAEQMRLMNESQIFLFPSLAEGFGLALAEAMAFGLAAVTSPVGFAADHLTDRFDARVVTATGEHLGAALVELAEDDVLRVRLAAQGRTTARSFTPDRMVASYERLFVELAERRRAGGRW